MSEDFEVIVVGGGPVGLLLANLLGSQAIRTLIIEREMKPRSSYRAIGINPPSLRILRKVGVLKAFLSQGLKAAKMVIHGTRFTLGKFDASLLSIDFPFLLSIPQSETERLLEENLKKFPSVTFLRGIECRSFETSPAKVLLKVRNHFDEKMQELCAPFVCACDGERSTIREKMQIPYIGNRYPQTFVMGDYRDTTKLSRLGHLYFTKYGSIESFPLPGNKRRWIIQTPRFIQNVKRGYLEQQIFLRTKMHLDPTTKISENPFGTNHFLISQFYKNRIFFCGDAAHTMSPVGGQGMNTGFADAEFVGHILQKVLREDVELDVLTKKYQFYRSIACRNAIQRAGTWMTIGTFKGRLLSGLRSFLIYCIMHTELIRMFVPFFLMLNIPYGTLEKVQAKEKEL